jgi:Xaa-Pro aminopeptidase
MTKIQAFVFGILIIFIVQGFNVQAQEAKARWDTLNLIRQEKLDIILPQAMRDNNIDMWIIVNKYGRFDPLSRELGGVGASDKWYQGKFRAYLVFTDRGGDKIERATMRDVTGALRKYVEERDPKRIAVNMSEYLGSADGLSHTCYLALVEALGEKYAKRLVSSEMLVSDLRSRRVASEISLFAKSIELTGYLMERGLSNEVIKPGITTLGDVAFWAADRLIARGHSPFLAMINPQTYGWPRIVYPEMPTSKDGRQLVRAPTGPLDRVIQRGDLVAWDGGIHIMGGYGTDIERYAYVLREGETDVPETIKDAFAHGVKVRELCRKLVKPGRTGLETLHLMYRKVKELGYEIQYEEDTVSDSPNIEINIGWHSVGEQGHGSGAYIWIDRDHPFASKLKLMPNQIQSFEFFVYYPLPEWGGKKLLLEFEDNVILTENGIELFIPPIEKIHLIR